MVIYLIMEMDMAMMTCMPIMTIRAMMDMKIWVTRCLENPGTDLRDLVNFKDISHIKFKVV